MTILAWVLLMINQKKKLKSDENIYNEINYKDTFIKTQNFNYFKLHNSFINYFKNSEKKTKLF